MQLAPQLEALIESKPSARLRRIDIGTWKSAVARQHGIRRLPTLWLYDGEKCVTKDAREVFMRVNSLN